MSTDVEEVEEENPEPPQKFSTIKAAIMYTEADFLRSKNSKTAALSKKRMKLLDEPSKEETDNEKSCCCCLFCCCRKKNPKKLDVPKKVKKR